jgi:DNA-binding MarR family transcriptional regulator
MSVPPRGHATKPPERPTTEQGQYLAFIYNYAKINRRPPAQADIQRYFRASAPTVHQMLVKLENAGFVRRMPGVARSIDVTIDPSAIPPLE